MSESKDYMYDLLYVQWVLNGEFISKVQYQPFIFSGCNAKHAVRSKLSLREENLPLERKT